MRIQTALSQANKIGKYIQECRDSGTNFYEATRDGFMELQSCIQKINDDLSEILCGSSAVHDSDSCLKSKPDSSNNSDVESKLNEILDLLKSHDERLDAIEFNGSTESVHVQASKIQSANMWSAHSNNGSDDTSDDILPDTADGDTSGTSKRMVNHVYAKVLKELQDVDHGSECINDICCILWDWFNARFLLNHRYNSNYRYSQKNFPSMIYSIIMDYGYHVEHGTTNTFKTQFYDWLSRLGTDTAVTNKGSTPMECYDIGCKHITKYGNPTALVIYTVLWELGLKNLTSTYSDAEAFPSECGIDMLLHQLNKYPEDSERYNHLKNPDILQELKILSFGEVLK